MGKLIAFLNLIATAEGCPLSAECIEWLETTIQRIELRKGDHLLRAGQICRNLYFIESGLLKCYYIHKGKSVIDWFFGELETVVSIDSFYDQIAGEDFIQAIEKSVLYYISHEQLDYAYRAFREFDKLGRVLTLKYLRVWHRQTRNVRMLSAKERYLLLLQTRPDLINRVDVKDMASFLGISRERLSKIRRDLLK